MTMRFVCTALSDLTTLGPVVFRFSFCALAVYIVFCIDSLLIDAQDLTDPAVFL
jgi:hypothetical protein